MRLKYPYWNLRRVNNLLTPLVISIGLYITLIPFLPHIQLWLEGIRDETGGYKYIGQLAATSDEEIDQEKLKSPPKGNRLVIPGIHIDDEIIIGESPNNVHLGVWHRPLTSTPDKGGNTVLVGHRFSYNDPATFYHLDKVDVGHKLAVWWQGTEYVYEVFEDVVVPASAVEIEQNTDDSIVTIYTCTPLWTAQDRLVIKARLITPQEDQA